MSAPQMIWKYGDFVHPPGEVTLVNTEVRALKNNRGQTWSKLVTLHVYGELLGTTQQEITNKIAAIELAYSENYRSAGLYHSDGVTPTPHVSDMAHPDMASGVQVDYRSYPRGDPDEFASVRTFYIRLSATFFDADSQLVHWSESVVTVGTGAPMWRWGKAWLGNTPFHVQQIINPQTTVQITQQGSVVGLELYPYGNVPGPLLPEWEHQEERVLGQLDPQWIGNRHANFPLTWRYVFEAPPGIAVTPNLV